MIKELLVLTHHNSYEKGTEELLKIKSDLEKNNKVIYFPRERKLSVKKEFIESLDIMYKLTNKGFSRERIEECYDVNDPFIYDEYPYDKIIHCGYLQILNFFYNLIAPKKLEYNIAIIDLFEKNLHPLVQRKLLMDLRNFAKVDKLIFTAYTELLLNEAKSYEECKIIEVKS